MRRLGCLLSGLMLLPQAAMALPIPDGTLNTQVRGSFFPGQVQIDGGTAVGANLFHSFDSFDIAPGEAVFFVGPASVERIFSRVTGGSVSTIDGILGTRGTAADVYLLNPSGIVFGPSASLAVQGSFYATTADQVQLGDTGRFSVFDPSGDRLLAVDPSAFLFSGTPAAIVSRAQGSSNPFFPIPIGGLQVPNGETLGLLGGDLRLESGSLRAERLQLTAVAAPGEVAFRQGAFELLPEQPRGDILLDGGATVEATGGGQLRLVADDIAIANGSRLITGSSLLGFLGTPAGTVDLDATGTVTLADRGEIVATVPRNGGGGGIVIAAKDLQLLRGGNITSMSIGSATAGDIVLMVEGNLMLAGLGPGINGFSNISAAVVGGSLFGEGGRAANIAINAGDILLDDGAAITSSNFTGQGTGGNIALGTDSLTVLAGSRITSLMLGDGQTGSITVQAQGNVQVDGTIFFDGRLFKSGINTELAPSSQGSTGSVDITARSLSVTNGAEISANTFGNGNAGNIAIKVKESIAVGRGIISSTVSANSQGRGGTISIVADRLTLSDSASLTSSTFGEGNSGQILIDARDSVQVFEGTIRSQVAAGANGQGGILRLRAGTVSIADESQLSTSTAGQGRAGSLIIESDGAVTFAPNSLATTQVETGATGAGGSMQITAGSLAVGPGARLLATTAGEGAAGSIVLTLAGQLSVVGGEITVASDSGSAAGRLEATAGDIYLEGGLLSAESTTVDGGDIFLRSDELLLLRRGSLISATAGSAQAGGSGGNVTIATPFIIAVPEENSDITANAFAGSGGQVNITALGLFGIQPRPRLTPRSDITASSELGNPGETRVNAIDTTFIENDLTDLPETLVNPDVLVAGSCAVRQGDRSSTITITGGGLPEADAATAYATGQVQTVGLATIEEPTALHRLPDGRLVMGQACGDPIAP